MYAIILIYIQTYHSTTNTSVGILQEHKYINLIQICTTYKTKRTSNNGNPLNRESQINTNIRFFI